jgi:hypothetical protein
MIRTILLIVATAGQFVFRRCLAGSTLSAVGHAESWLRRYRLSLSSRDKRLHASMEAIGRADVMVGGRLDWSNGLARRLSSRTRSLWP